MKKMLVILLAFVLLVGFVSAEDGWEEFVDDEAVESDDDSDVGDIGSDEVGDSEANVDSSPYAGETASSSGKSTERTQDFYIALGVGGGALLIFLLLLFLLLKRPRNKWKKK